MNLAMPARQRGLGFSGFIFGAFVLVLVVVTGLKMLPPYIQNAEIQNLFDTIANDAEMQGAAARDIRASFTRRVSIDDITAIKAEDIDISSDAGKPVLSASYSVKVPLVANVSLYLDFSPHSASR